MSVQILEREVGLSRSMKGPADPINRTGLGSAPLDALHGGNVAVLLAADIILQTDIVPLLIDETRAPIPREHLRIVHRDDVLDLARADFTDALARFHRIAVRRAGRVQE